MKEHEPPSWADLRFEDDGFVEYRRAVGRIVPGNDDPIAVKLVQGAETQDSSATAGQSPQVQVGGIRLDREQAADLARLIDSALQLSI